MQVRCFQIDPRDNVATLLDDAGEPGEASLLGAAAGATCPLAEPIASGHKVALSDIDAGSPVTKFGVTIGLATERIARGRWVHLHNCRSLLDERSATLDLHTGAAKDTQYE